MFHRSLARSCAWFGLLALAVAACGTGDPPSTVTTPTSASTTTSTAAEAASSTSTTLPATTTPTTASVRTIEAAFANGQVVGGARRETVRLGERVRVRVTSDVVDEVHIHTYDVKAAVAAGQTVELEVVATIPGRHEVELEKKRKQLLTLEVR